MWVKLTNPGSGGYGLGYWSVDQIISLGIYQQDSTHYFVVVNGNSNYQLTGAYSTLAGAQASLDAFAEQLGVVTPPA